MASSSRRFDDQYVALRQVKRRLRRQPLLLAAMCNRQPARRAIMAAG
jgi:hypothetical protein